jgi:hypothetical protein
LALARVSWTRWLLDHVPSVFNFGGFHCFALCGRETIFTRPAAASSCFRVSGRYCTGPGILSGSRQVLRPPLPRGRSPELERFLVPLTAPWDCGRPYLNAADLSRRLRRVGSAEVSFFPCGDRVGNR